MKYLALIIVLYATQLSAAEVQLHRLAVVDVSDSMDGARLLTVKRELRKLVLQMPPTPQHPISVILFSSDPEPAVTFKTEKSFLDFVDQIRTDGGTNIAGALKFAAHLLASAKAANVVLLFYTDGQDGNTKGISAAEAEIDAICGQRKQAGLSTNVFVKRWGTTSGLLLPTLTKSENLNVVEVGDLAVTPIVLDPLVKIDGVRATKNYGEYEIAYRVAARTKRKVSQPLAVTFTVMRPTAEGGKVTSVKPNVASKTRRIKVHLDPKQIQSRQFTLPFAVAPRLLPTEDVSEYLLPFIPRSRMATIISLPPPAIPLKTELTYKLDEAPTWSDIYTLKAQFAGHLLVEITGPESMTGEDHEFLLQLAVDAPAMIAGPISPVRVQGPGKYKCPFRIDVFPVDRSVSPSDLQYSVSFRIVPKSVPPNVKLTPPILTIDSGPLPKPDNHETEVVVQLPGEIQAKWQRLPELAQFEASFPVEVIGPIAPDTKLQIISPPGITHVALEPSTIRAGTQSLSIKALARLRPYPHRNTLKFTVAPLSNANLPIDLMTRTHWHFDVVGPPAVTLRHFDGKQLTNVIKTTLPDNANQSSLTVYPMVAGLRGRTAFHSRIRSIDANLRVPNSPLPIGSPTTLQIATSQPNQRSFWQDTTETHRLVIEPSTKNESVKGTELLWLLTYQAPIRRITFYLSIVVSVLVVTGLTLWTIHKWQSPVTIDD